MQYLKDRNYYNDRYDLMTIEDCCRFIDILKGKITRDRETIESFKLADEKGFVGALGEFMLYFKKGDWYRNKEKTIDEWMERDRAKQDKYEKAVEPKSIFCDDCNWEMSYEDKTLYDFSDEPLKILFFFRCPNCKKGKGIFDNGDIFIPKVPTCPECGRDLETKRTRKGEVITTIEKCGCGYKNKDVWDMKAESDDHKKKEENDRQLLVKYRTECCLSKEDGDRYLSDQATTLRFLENEKERKVKEADPKYQKAKNLKKIKVSELQKLIEETITVSGYDSLNFDKPEIDRHIIISFSVQDTNTNRSDYDASRDLKRSLTKVLKTTNWRLMSDGIGNRLGLLYGRVKGYENEDDLVKIV